RGDDAVGAAAIAALGDLQPTLELALAAGRQVAGEVLELEVPLRGQRVGVEELGQLVDLAGAEGDVDEREALEHLVLDRLRPATADADGPARVFALQPFRLAQVADEAAVGRLADRAGVEEDQVGFAALRRLLVAERGEHAPHPLGVVHVHLAPEGGDVKALHALRVPREIRRAAGLLADDFVNDVRGDVFDFFFRQDAAERRHPAAAVGDLLDRAFFGLRERHRRQIRATVAAVAGGAVTGRAVFGEDDGSRFGVTAGRGFRAFGFASFGFRAFFRAFAAFRRFFATFFRFAARGFFFFLFFEFGFFERAG